MGETAKVNMEISQLYLQGKYYKGLAKNINVFNPQEILKQIETEYQNEFNLNLTESSMKENEYILAIQSTKNDEKKLTVKIDLSLVNSKLIII